MPVDSEQVAVDRIAELRAQGRTFPEIVRELNTEMADVSRVGRWSVAQVQKIAKRV
jgi:transcriptional regulator